MKVIFLDVDGELTYSNYRNDKTADIDIEKVKLLKEICDKTNAKVVISSSWRGTKDYTPLIYYILRGILSANGIEVIGDTPHIKTELTDGPHKTMELEEIEELEKIPEIMGLEEISEIKCKYGTGRAAEIQKWIATHEVENFVILDDADWQWSDYGYKNNWVRPTWFGDGGLKREHAEKAIEILNHIDN